MNAERLLALYERVVDARDAIARLRRFVLDLAVRGRLVPQDPNEEPAAPKCKAITNTALPFTVPQNWSWMRVGDQLDLLNGMAFKPTDWQTSGLRIVRIQNLNNSDAPFNFCQPELARERALIDDGSFLISWSGTPGTSFGAFIWDRGPAVLNQHIFRCDFKTNSFDPKFLRMAVNGRLDEMISKAHGGVGLQHITKGKLEDMLLPLPPLAEQRRIVEKVEELMALLDRLEDARQHREATRDRLTAATLTRLTAPDTPAEEAASDARFALNTLPALTTRPDQIKHLRQTILNLAVRGRLVPQDPNDEPASELLKRVAAEKARLVKAGDIRKPRDVADGAVSQPPFAIPSTWLWCRLDAIGAIIGGGTPPADDEANFTTPGTGLPWLTPADLGACRSLYIARGARDLTEKGFHSSSATMLPAGSVLFTSRAPIGYVAIASNPISTNQGFKSIVPYIADFSRYIALGMQTFAPEIDAMAPGTTFKEVSGKIVAGIPFPLPPLAEQRRIVEKVEELMSLLDRLDAALKARNDLRAKLLESVLHETLAGDTAAPALEAMLD